MDLKGSDGLEGQMQGTSGDYSRGRVYNTQGAVIDKYR